jgi:hypothetical protein
MECDHFYQFSCARGAKIEREGKQTLSMALAFCVESTQKVYQVGAKNTGLCFYSIPINGINRVFFIPKPGGNSKKSLLVGKNPCGKHSFWNKTRSTSRKN